MLDIKFVRENPDIVKENIRKKFQNAKLPLVDEAIALDAQRRQAIADGEGDRAILLRSPDVWVPRGFHRDAWG